MRTPNCGVIPNLSKSFSREFSLEMFRRGSFTRQFEYQVKHAFDQKIFQIPIYLCIGQEFNPAAYSMVLKDFQIFAQHRAHGIYLSFGAPPEKLRDELILKNLKLKGHLADCVTSRILLV